MHRIALAVAGVALTAGSIVLHTEGSAAGATMHQIRNLPTCTVEDGSSGPLPCSWNVHQSGNGHGRKYWIDRHQQVHYLHR